MHYELPVWVLTLITDWPTFWRPPHAIFKLDDPGRTRTGASLKALAETTKIAITRNLRENILYNLLQTLDYVWRD